MFIPIEPALLTLYNDAEELIERAWQKKIIIVGPSTLPFLLKAVENMWRIDKQSKTIKDIATTASEIFLEDKTEEILFAKKGEEFEKYYFKDQNESLEGLNKGIWNISVVSLLKELVSAIRENRSLDHGFFKRVKEDI